jgi:hypothetical protein
VGDVATATAFTLAFVAELIVGLYVLTYAMHCLLVVVRNTADGNDEVTWPSEPFQDWVGGALHLVVVVVVVLAPAGVVSRALGKQWLQDDPALRFLILSLPALWLLFPVALFSSLSGSSRWFVFRPVVVWNMLRVAPSTFALYLLSALLAAAVAGLGYAAVATKWVVLLFPVAVAGAAAAFLIYARLLGRLGWRMGLLPAGKRKAAKKPRPKVRGVEVSDPWAVPEQAEAPLPEEETTAFGQKRRRVKGYGLAAEQLPKRPETPPPEPTPQPIRAEQRTRAEPRPGSPFLGVVAFPWYERSRKAWLLLSLGFLAAGTIGYVIVSLYAKLAAQM